MGEYVLSGADLTPPTLLYRLHDTGLKPTHVLLDAPPVDGVPLQEVVGDRTSNAHRSHGWFCRHLLCLLSRLVRCSRDERPDGSLPAFAWGDVADAQPLSNPLQVGVRFFRPP